MLRILLSIGGTEIMHFQTWQDKAGNAPALTDPTTGLTFPDLNADGELTQTNLIMPEPTIFLDRKFPLVSIIRPTETTGPPWARSRPSPPMGCSSANRRSSLPSSQGWQRPQTRPDTLNHPTSGHPD